jgi:hypothetical protein
MIFKGSKISPVFGAEKNKKKLFEPVKILW